jgi:hypothetical protein
VKTNPDLPKLPNEKRIFLVFRRGLDHFRFAGGTDKFGDHRDAFFLGLPAYDAGFHVERFHASIPAFLPISV